MIIHKTRYATGCSLVHTRHLFFPSSCIEEKHGLTAAFSRDLARAQLHLIFFLRPREPNAFPSPSPARERGPDSLSARVSRTHSIACTRLREFIVRGRDRARDRPAIKRRRWQVRAITSSQGGRGSGCLFARGFEGTCFSFHVVLFFFFFPLPILADSAILVAHQTFDRFSRRGGSVVVVARVSTLTSRVPPRLLSTSR